MEKNKTGKYFKYAIGEIVLVVIGILIALQINNWNSDRLEKNEEQNALINLEKDFILNKKNLEDVISDTKKYIQSDLTILNFNRNGFPQKSEAEFNKLLDDLTALSEFFPSNSFLDNLLNSGNLSLIKNQKLRNKLSSWKPKIEKIKDKENNTRQYETSALNFIIKNGSWLNVDEVSNSKVTKKYNLPKSRFKIDNRNLLDYPEFENMVENLIVHKNSVNDSQEVALKLVNEILELIEQELKK